MKIFSMFSGIGGFELGIQQALGKDNVEFIGYSEIDKYAISIYEKHFNHKNYGDATKLITTDLQDFDLLVGGFPCQSFSIAGKRKGFNDTRGTLFFEIARVLRDKRPRYLLLENVKGLLSSNEGKTFQTILGVLTEIGYQLEWQVLNSKNFGVPQNRERVFIVGYLGKGSRPKVFPIGGDDEEISREIINKHSSKKWNQVYRVYDTEGISPTLNTPGGGHHIPKIEQIGNIDRPGNDISNRVFSSNGLSKTLCGQGGGAEEKTGLYKMGMKIRRLTPTECERLQGFPDGLTEYGVDEGGNDVKISDTQRYKCLGNAISCPVVEAIFSNLLIKNPQRGT